MTPQGKRTQSSSFSQLFPLNQSKVLWKFVSVFIVSIGEVALETHDLFMRFHKPNFFFFSDEFLLMRRLLLKSDPFISSISASSIEKKLQHKLFVALPMGKEFLL